MDAVPALHRWVRVGLVVIAALLVGVFAVAVWLRPYDDAGQPRRMETHLQLGLPPCTFYVMTGLPCPSCGMTTSFAFFVRGDLWNSLRANAVGTVLALFCLALVPWSLACAVRGRTYVVRSLEQGLMSTILVFMALLLLRWGILLGLNWSGLTKVPNGPPGQSRAAPFEHEAHGGEAMARVRHPWRLVGLILAAVACFGCNMLSLPFFLMTGMDPKHEPKCKLAPDDKDHEVKVLILASKSHLETRPESLRVDRELAGLMVRELQKSYKENKENVTLVPAAKVEKFKDEHPNWRALDVREIGKHFKADYVINLEVNSLSMYEKGSSNTLYRGHADISIKVVDVSKGEDETMYDEEYTSEFPRTRGPISVDDNSAQQFRQLFLSQVARELCWRFTAHSTKDDYTCLN